MKVDHELIKIQVSEIKTDPTNPNRLSSEQMKSLRESMERFGYLEPVIVDQNNLVADGEHRLAVFKEVGQEEIPCYRIHFDNDNERLLLRQAKNKIKGEHDPALDLAELEKLSQYNKNALESLVRVSTQDIENMRQMANVGLQRTAEGKVKLDDEMTERIKQANAEVESGGYRTQDKGIYDSRADVFLHGNIKQIVCYFDNEEYRAIIPKLAEIMDHFNVDNHTDMLSKLVDMWYGIKNSGSLGDPVGEIENAEARTENQGN